MRMYKAIAIVVLGATLAALTFAAPAFGDTNSGFVSWGDVKATEPGNITDGATRGYSSPHGGYKTNTVKCGVCHAVHKSTPGGQVLLRSTVANACTYCHVDLTGYLSAKRVYDSSLSKYLGDTPYGHQSYGAPERGTQCIFCHQVHAADSDMTEHTYLTQKILTGPKTQDPGSPGYDARFETAPNDTDDPLKEQALTKWCTKCHRADTTGTYTYYSPYYSDKTHVMKAPEPAGYSGDGPSAQGLDVAWATSEYCSSCHMKGYGTSSWPHYVSSKRFLVSADGSGTPSADITGTVTTNVDGVCLRCHKRGSYGVGTSF